MKPTIVGLPSEQGRTTGRSRHALLLTIAVCVVLLLANGAFTQYLARAFAYSPQLGKPLLGTLYPPWAWYEWMRVFGPYHRSIFLLGFLLMIMGCIVGVALSQLAIGFLVRRSRAVRAMHGSAHWASEEEIRASGLLPPKSSWFRKKKAGSGVYVGAYRNARGKTLYLRHNGPEHIMCFAPTRSGKGVGLILPTLLSWPHSCVVNDLKGENWELTAGWRKRQGHRVLKFDPIDKEGMSARYNPLEEIRLGTDDEVADAQNLVNVIIDPDGKGLADHWDKTSLMFLVGVVLFAMYREREQGRVCSMPTLATTMTSVEGVEKLYVDMKDNHFGPNGAPHPVIQKSAIDMLEKEDRERGSVLSTTKTFFALFDDPIVCRNVARSDFKVRDLMNTKEPVTLYLVIDPQNKDRLRPLVRLMITQIVRNLTPRMKFAKGSPVRSYQHRLLLLLDEFDALGKLPIFQGALAHIAGYGLKAYIFVQDLSQLKHAYGEHEAISAACHIKSAYAPNSVETAKKLSDMTGTATVVKSVVTTSGRRFGFALGQVSESLQESSRQLLTPDECMRLPSAKKDPNEQDKVVEPGDMLIFAAGSAPIYGKQILFFLDPVFKARAAIPAPLKSDRIVQETKA